MFIVYMVVTKDYLLYAIFHVKRRNKYIWTSVCKIKKNKQGKGKNGYLKEWVDGGMEIG